MRYDYRIVLQGERIRFCVDKKLRLEIVNNEDAVLWQSSVEYLPAIEVADMRGAARVQSQRSVRTDQIFTVHGLNVPA